MTQLTFTDSFPSLLSSGLHYSITIDSRVICEGDLDFRTCYTFTPGEWKPVSVKLVGQASVTLSTRINVDNMHKRIQVCVVARWSIFLKHVS